MSKKLGDVPQISWGPAYVVSDSTPDRFFGKLCEIVETVGFQQKQEDAIKGLIRKTIWDVFNNDAIFISTDKHNEIHDEWNRKREEGNINPIS